MNIRSALKTAGLAPPAPPSAPSPAPFRRQSNTVNTNTGPVPGRHTTRTAQRHRCTAIGRHTDYRTDYRTVEPSRYRPGTTQPRHNALVEE